MLRRQSSLNQLFGTVRLALADPQVNSVLLHDWRRQDVHALAKAAIQAAIHFNSSASEFRKRRSDIQVNSSTVDFIASRNYYPTVQLYRFALKFRSTLSLRRVRAPVDGAGAAGSLHRVGGVDRGPVRPPAAAAAPPPQSPRLLAAPFDPAVFARVDGVQRAAVARSDRPVGGRFR